MELLKKSPANSSIVQDPKARQILATGMATSAIVASLLAGLALVVYSLRDLHLLIELKREPPRAG